jgi:ABC-type multidrug transport system ATPase subunit/ABC-type multidrug transport system permease subunit
LNNYEVDPTRIDVRKQIAFVAQDDSLQVTATPREAIKFSARLRLPRSTTNEEVEQLTERMLKELGLVDCADTIIGGALIKGISGGQRKRTSVGLELVTKPALVFLDEPTSGLDSFSAVQLCQVLKKVANAGSSVLFTIHQPASEIFNSFDHLILMNKGRVMFQGATHNVPSFFSERGQPVPANYNPADWIMNVAQAVEFKQLESAGFFPKDDRPVEDAFEVDDSVGRDALGVTVHSKDGNHDHRPVSMLTEINLLFRREATNFKRDTVALATKFGLTIFLGILIGVIFYDVGATSNEIQSNVQSRFGALIMCMMIGMFGTAQDALQSFPQERPLFLREYSTNHYSSTSYFLSRLTMESIVVFIQIMCLCLVTYFLIGFQMGFWMYMTIIYCLALASTALAVMLGSAIEDPKLATEMLPLLFVPQMLFAGFFVAPALIPSWLRWAQYLCSLTYATRLMTIEEFTACSGPGVENCYLIIESIDADKDETYWYWIVLISIFVVFRLLALAILTKKATKFY